MKISAEMKDRLIASAVTVVARDGLSKATTKAIAAEADLNEAYIYRAFDSKEDLLKEAMKMEDRNFVALLSGQIALMKNETLSWRERSYQLWSKAWNFITSIPDDCSFYIRYYYSANYRTYAQEEHLQIYRPIIEHFRSKMRPGVNTELLVHQIFVTMLAFAAKVIDGSETNDEKLKEFVFSQIYSFVQPHLLDDYQE